MLEGFKAGAARPELGWEDRWGRTKRGEETPGQGAGLRLIRRPPGEEPRPGSPLRVGIVTPGYRPSNAGLVRQVELLALSLKAAGHEVSVLVTYRALARVDRLMLRFGYGPAAGLAVDLPATRLVQGVPVHLFNLRGWEHAYPVLSLVKKVLRRIPFLGKDAEALLTEVQVALPRRIATRSIETLMDRVDVLHIHDKYPWQVFAMRTAVAQRKPFVATTYLHFKGSTEACPPATVAALNQSKRVLALLPTEAEALRALGVTAPIGVCGIAVGTLPDASPGSFRVRHNLGPGPIVLFVGRLVAYKGVFQLLEAQKLVSKERPDAQLVFVGPDAVEFREKLRLESHPNVHYLGEFEDTEKVAALSSCAMLCLPSTDEVFPVVVAEAWTLARAVVGGPAHGLRELIEGHGGGVVAAQDAQSIAEAILRLLSDDALRDAMGRRGQSLMCNTFSNKHFVSACVEAYEAAVRMPPARNP